MNHLRRFAQAFVVSLGAFISLTTISLLWLTMIGGFYLLFDIFEAFPAWRFPIGWFWMSLSFASFYTLAKYFMEKETRR